MFWYTFMLHDFGQNEWEEKSDRNIVYKVEKLEKLEKAHVGAAPEVKREDVTIQEDTQNILREKQNNICEVVIERPFSVRKIMFEKSKKDSLDDDKESDSGVGAESPNAVTTPENEAADEDDDDDDVQIDELFICRSKSAFSRPSIDEAVSEFGLGDKEGMVNDWVTNVKKKIENGEVTEWWKEVGAPALRKEGMSEKRIKEFWESKTWFGGHSEVMMEMVAGKIWEMRKENERTDIERALKTIDVEDLSSDTL